MDNKDLAIILLFFIILGALGLTLYQINHFMPVFKTCSDDFAVIKECHCLPCSWQDANTFNGNKDCDSGELFGIPNNSDLGTTNG